MEIAIYVVATKTNPPDQYTVHVFLILFTFFLAARFILLLPAAMHHRECPISGCNFFSQLKQQFQCEHEASSYGTHRASNAVRAWAARAPSLVALDACHGQCIDCASCPTLGGWISVNVFKRWLGRRCQTHLSRPRCQYGKIHCN